MKLSEIKQITGKIILKSGLHIGAGDTEMRIGGTDNPVIKHPHTLEPYIPGSSLKGKVRSLLEMRSGLMVRTEGKPVSMNLVNELEGPEKVECEKILKLFGSSSPDVDQGKPLGPTRVSMADCPFNDEWKKEAVRENLALTEIKSETSINRIEGTAATGTLRTTERVPAHAEFDFCISLKKFENDEDLEQMLLEGLKLLEMDALGGSGSRGYGQVRFEFDDAAIHEKFKTIQPL